MATGRQVNPTSAKNLLGRIDMTHSQGGYLGSVRLPEAMRPRRRISGVYSLAETDAVATHSIGCSCRYHPTAAGFLVFLLLSDVPDDGAATVVLKGSHRVVYARRRREKNFFAHEEVDFLQRRYGWESKICSAPAGSLVFFDSQALHRGRRSRQLRDAFQVNCMTKRNHLWPQEITRDVFSSLSSEEQRTLLHRARLKVV